jgi:hypothetical protein
LSSSTTIADSIIKTPTGFNNLIGMLYDTWFKHHGVMHPKIIQQKNDLATCGFDQSLAEIDQNIRDHSVVKYQKPHLARVGDG